MRPAITAFVLSALALLAPEARADSSVHEVSLRVGGMSCGGCAARLGRVLRAQPGVLEAEVDFDAHTAYVRFDPRRISPDALEERTTAAGFEATRAPFHVRWRGEATAIAGQATSVELVLAAGADDAYLHPDRPIAVVLEAGGGVELARRKLARAHGRAVGEPRRERLLTFAVPLTGTTPGTHTIAARVTFSLCSAGACTKKTATTRLSLQVIERR